MSLELNKETIRINQAIVEDSIQTVIENDIIVPDSKPDISNILVLDGDALVKSVDITQDKLMVNGMLNCNILYTPEGADQGIKSINSNSDFSCTMELAGAKQGMNSNVKCEVEHIDYNILNSRKMGIKAFVRVTGQVNDTVDVNIVNELMGIENVQVLKTTTNINSFIGRSDVELSVRESLDIPAGKPSIAEILRNDIKITGKDVKIAENKIIAKGELNVCTLYTGQSDNNSIECIENEIPFVQFIELDDITEDTKCDLNIDIKDAQFLATEDGDGEPRVLNVEAQLRISAACFNKKSVDVIDDAYSPACRLGIEKKQIIVEDTFAESKTQVTLKDTIALEEGSPEISEVFNVVCKPSLYEYRLADDKLVVEGVVNASVLYLTGIEAQPVSSCRQEIPFRQTIDMKSATSDMKCAIELEPEHCSYSMVSPSEVEIRLSIGITAKVTFETPFPVISKVVEQPVEDKKLASQPSIVIYFAQPGDTLWNIAKKYLTTVSDIANVNSLDGEESLHAGQQIIIPKKSQ